MPTYYYGWEGIVDWGYESPTAYGTAVTPTERLSWVRSITLTVDENVERHWFLGSNHFRKADVAIKGIHEVTGTITFWLADDLDATMMDAWILKMPCDAYNVAYTTDSWDIPNTAVSVYGSNDLPSFTLETGFNKSGNIRRHIIDGCVVDTFTMRARRGERVECTLDFIGRSASLDNPTAFQSLSRSTAPPLGWEHVRIGYATDGTETARTDFTAFEFTISNNLTANYDLSSTSPSRALTNIIPGRQEISGSATINLTTESGMALYDALLNDASAPYTPAEDVKKKQFNFDIRNTANPDTQAIEWTFRNVVIGEVPVDIDPTKVQEVTFPWTAEYYLLELITPDTTAPTNWDDQS